MEAPVEAELKPQISEIKAAQWFSPKETLNRLGYKKDSEKILRRAFADSDWLMCWEFLINPDVA